MKLNIEQQNTLNDIVNIITNKLTLLEYNSAPNRVGLLKHEISNKFSGVELLNMGATMPNNTKINSMKLVASAGCGKTVLAGELIEVLINKKLRVSVCTPTHKSIEVLRSKIDEDILEHDNIITGTIHSFLSLKLKSNKDGIQELVDDSMNKRQRPVDVLIVDEASMVGDDLVEHIDRKLNSGGIEYVLYIGDALQLPPVSNTPDYLGIGPKFVDAQVQFELLNIVRQAADNPVIKHAQEFRGYIESKSYPQLDTLLKDTDILQLTDRRELLNHYINNTGDKVLLSYTNKAVDNYNNYLRNVDLGELANNRFNIGETLIFNEMYNLYNNIINNNTIVVIKDIKVKYNSSLGVNYYWITTSCGREFRVLYEDSTEWFNHLQNKLIQGKKWKKFYENKASFATVAYTYASTIHKSQGSTVSSVYIDYQSIVWQLQNNPHIEHDIIFRLIYVAITRTSDKVILLR